MNTNREYERERLQKCYNTLLNTIRKKGFDLADTDIIVNMEKEKEKVKVIHLSFLTVDFDERYQRELYDKLFILCDGEMEILHKILALKDKDEQKERLLDFVFEGAWDEDFKQLDCIERLDIEHCFYFESDLDDDYKMLETGWNAYDNYFAFIDILEMDYEDFLNHKSVYITTRGRY
jgi:hypothetical protein